MEHPLVDTGDVGGEDGGHTKIAMVSFKLMPAICGVPPRLVSQVKDSRQSKDQWNVRPDFNWNKTQHDGLWMTNQGANRRSVKSPLRFTCARGNNNEIQVSRVSARIGRRGIEHLHLCPYPQADPSPQRLQFDEHDEGASRTAANVDPEPRFPNRLLRVGRRLGWRRWRCGRRRRWRRRNVET